MDKENQQQIIPTVQAAVDFLSAQSWKLSVPGLYRHIKQMKIRRTESGGFDQKSLLRYASRHLKKKDGSFVAAETEKAQQQRIDADTRKALAQAQLAEAKARAISGDYMLRKEVERNFAARASVLKSDLFNFCHESAPRIIALLNGDSSKTADLIEHMISRVDVLLGRYAEPVKFEVPFPILPDEENEKEENEENEVSFHEAPGQRSPHGPMEDPAEIRSAVELDHHD